MPNAPRTARSSERPRQGEPKGSRLKRPLHEMPADIRQALLARELLGAYDSRPAYQRNDYLGWIMRAKRAETREKRLNQMLEELASGDRYMNMKYRPHP
jgi:uncharacterized protein YdeI (YjbR/CyaY-like superfamily)